MKSYVLTKVLLPAILLAVFCGAAFAEGHGGEARQKRGILLVSFGTSLAGGQEAINAMEAAVKEAYPDVEVRMAYTSRIIMRKLAREQNRIVDEPAVALANMAYEGFTDVAVLSTHVIPGAEYQDLEAVVDGFRVMRRRGTKAGFNSIVLSKPLLANAHDCERLAQALHDTFAADLEEGAVVLVGHGTHHFADAAYGALQIALWQKSPNFFFGAVEGLMTYDQVLANLKRAQLSRVTVAPAMLVAGDHAENDIGGDEDDSWKTMLSAEGYTVTPKLRGLGEIEEVRNLYLEKFREAWGAL